MNLKSFATQRYLDGDSELLDYVISDATVPVAVLEKEFDVVDYPVSGLATALLSESYMEFLQKTVPIGLVKTGEHTFEVTGELPDSVIEILEKLHGVDKTDVVNQLIVDMMHDFSSDRDVEVGSISFEASPVEVKEELDVATDVEASVEETVENLDERIDEFESSEYAELVYDVPEVPEAVEFIESDVVSTIDGLIDDDIRNDGEQPDVSNLDFDATYHEGEFDETFEPTDGFDDMVDEPGVAYDEFDTEADEEHISTDEYAMGLKRVYDTVVERIKALGINQRLDIIM